MPLLCLAQLGVTFCVHRLLHCLRRRSQPFDGDMYFRSLFGFFLFSCARFCCCVLAGSLTSPWVV